MRDRVFSLETEYAVAFHRQDGTAVDPTELVRLLSGLLVGDYGVPGSWFLANGSKFAPDVGHAEWSHPECRSAREAAIYDKAADFQLRQVLPGVEAMLAGRGKQGTLRLIKNNSDTVGNSYGCHENYMTPAETKWLGREDQLRLTARFLLPFLVTRQVICGSGRVGLGSNLQEGHRYQIMQRADFLDRAVSKETTTQRAIVNIGREAEPLADMAFRRLHLILGDANMSGWATYLKLGTTGLMLRLLEDMRFGDIPHLVDPVSAMRQISRDPSCTVRVATRDGRELTAVEIQTIYLHQVQDYLRDAPCSDEERQILDLWQEALDDLIHRPELLVGRVDWLTKKAVLDRVLARQNLTWSDDLRRAGILPRLQEIDIKYHSLDKAEGLFYQLIQGDDDGFFSNEQIRVAATTPPPFTRARIRGDIIASARRSGVGVRVDRWEELTLGGSKLDMSDPLVYFLPEAYRLLAPPSGKTP